MFDLLGNKALIIVSILGVLLTIFSKWVFDKNVELRAELKNEKEIYTKTVEAYEKRIELEQKIQKIKQETQVKKDEVVTANTKLKVEITKRDKIKELKNENPNSNDDFSTFTF